MTTTEMAVSAIAASIAVIFVCGAVLACAAVYKVLKDGFGS